MTDERRPFIDCRGITKRFAGVTALDDVSLSVARGSCHALVGENGAGKSTLGKVLAGIHRPDDGVVTIDGRARRFASPRDAARAGIGMVHQELAFCPDLTVAENLCLGRYPRRLGVLLNLDAMRDRARQRLGQIGVELDVTRPMRELSTAQEQLVQIAAAVGTGARILVFDEPTSSLSQREAQRLFELIRQLRGRGVTTIYVSHRLAEVFELCDAITVLRDGRCVDTVPCGETTPDAVVRMMIGRAVGEYFPAHLSGEPGEVSLRVDGLRSPGLFEDVSFTVRSGEIVALAGLVGAGRSEVARAIFGLDARAEGRVEVEGKAVRPGHAKRAMRAGLGLVPEDRKRQGLVMPMRSRANISLASLGRISLLGLLNHAAERRLATEQFERLDVRAPSIDTPTAALSGGNQQKLVLAKWLARGCRVLMVDEPTRGVDVGAKAAVHALVDGLARRGVAVLLISSELPEVLNLSTRILVMRRGRLVGELPRSDATQDRLLRLMAGVDDAA